MPTPQFAPYPRSFIQTIPTARVHYRGYEYWCEGFHDTESHDAGYRYQVRKIGANTAPATCHEPFDMVTKASFAARDSIDRLLAVLEPKPEAAPEVETPDPTPKRKTAKKPKAAAVVVESKPRSRKKPKPEPEPEAEEVEF